MKKVVSIVVFVVLVIVSINVKAVSENGSTVNMSFEQTVNQDSVVITIKLGDFVSVTEDSVMVATMSLDYDENIITDIQGTTSNNWDITIQKETKSVLLETDHAMPNTEVAQIKFNINPDAQTIESTVGLKEINVAASISELDENYNDVTVNFTANPETPTTPSENETGGGNTTNETGNNTVNNIGNSTLNGNNIATNNSSNRTNSISANRDNTTASSRLPDTGIGNILIIAIVIIAICIIIFKIKSRKIKY